MAERSRSRPTAAGTRTSKKLPSQEKAKDAPGPEKPSAGIRRAKAASRASARRGDGKGSREAQAPDGMVLGPQASGEEAPNGQEAQETGADQSTKMRGPAGSKEAAPGPASGQGEVASAVERKGTPATQTQEASQAEPDAADTDAPPPPSAEGGTNGSIAGRPKRQRGSAREASDTAAGAADAGAPTKRRSRRAIEGLGEEAAADTEAASKRPSQPKPSVLVGEREKVGEKSQAAASGALRSAGRPPRNRGVGSQTEPAQSAGAAIGDLAGQAAVTAARSAEIERMVAMTGLPVESSMETSIRTVTAELTEFAFRSLEEGMKGLRELSRIRTLPELAEFQARQAQAAVAAWQHHAARMNEIYQALLKPKDTSRK